MISIAAIVTELLAKPGPVLCLDTCDLLDVLRGTGGKGLDHCRSFVRLLDNLSLNPGRFHIVITYLVEHEWDQNFEAVLDETSRDVQKTMERLKLVDEVRSQVGLAALDLVEFEAPRIVEGLLNLARRVIDQAFVLEQDRQSVDNALNRVMAQKRPSHKNQIKDSIHFEHYLELARRLRSSGFAEPCLFVSGNTADFCARDSKLRIHPDLESDLQAAGLTFFARLEDAVRQLGI